MSPRRAVFPLLVALLVVAGLAGAAVTSGAAKEPVKIVDYDFKPKSLTVAKGTRISFRWSKANTAPHNVKLKSAPKGVKRRLLAGGATGIDYRKPYGIKLRKSGTYRFVCTIHTFMKLKVKVRR